MDFASPSPTTIQKAEQPIEGETMGRQTRLMLFFDRQDAPQPFLRRINTHDAIAQTIHYHPTPATRHLPL